MSLKCTSCGRDAKPSAFHPRMASVYPDVCQCGNNSFEAKLPSGISLTQLVAQTIGAQQPKAEEPNCRECQNYYVSNDGDTDKCVRSHTCINGSAFVQAERLKLWRTE